MSINIIVLNLKYMQLEATYEFFFLNALFVSLRQSGCKQSHNFAPNAGKDFLSFICNRDFCTKIYLYTRNARCMRLAASLQATAHKSFFFFYQGNPSTKVPTYAVLNHQSPDVFITDSLLKQQD